MGDTTPRTSSSAGSDDSSPSWVRVLIIGGAGGLLAGLFGVGGGIVMVPLLVAWLGMGQRQASATSLLAIVPIAVGATAGYATTGSIDPLAAGLLLAGGVVGGQLGAHMLPRTPVARLQLWFGVLSLATAVRLLLDDGGGSTAPTVGRDGVLGAVLMVVLGLLAGMLAGLLGIGGGIVMVPGLVLLSGADADVARGTSLVVVIGTALTASIANARNGLVHVRLAMASGLVGVPAGMAGALIGQWMPGRAALTMFAGLLAWSGLRMIQRSRGRRRRDEGGILSS